MKGRLILVAIGLAGVLVGCSSSSHTEPTAGTPSSSGSSSSSGTPSSSGSSSSSASSVSSHKVAAWLYFRPVYCEIPDYAPPAVAQPLDASVCSRGDVAGLASTGLATEAETSPVILPYYDHSVRYVLGPADLDQTVIATNPKPSVVLSEETRTRSKSTSTLRALSMPLPPSVTPLTGRTLRILRTRVWRPSKWMA